MYKIAALLCETPLTRIPFINQWIDDQFDRMECERIFAALDAIGGVEGLLEDIETNPDKYLIMTPEMLDEVDRLVEGVDDKEIKPENVRGWLRRLSDKALTLEMKTGELVSMPLDEVEEYIWNNRGEFATEIPKEFDNMSTND